MVIGLTYRGRDAAAFKPETRIYHLAAHRLGVCPEELLFVDDSPENITGAERAGVRGILFESTEQVMENLGELLGTRA